MPETPKSQAPIHTRSKLMIRVSYRSMVWNSKLDHSRPGYDIPSISGCFFFLDYILGAIPAVLPPEAEVLARISDPKVITALKDGLCGQQVPRHYFFSLLSGNFDIRLEAFTTSGCHLCSSFIIRVLHEPDSLVAIQHGNNHAQFRRIYLKTDTYMQGPYRPSSRMGEISGLEWKDLTLNSHDRAGFGKPYATTNRTWNGESASLEVLWANETSLRRRNPASLPILLAELPRDSVIWSGFEMAINCHWLRGRFVLKGSGRRHRKDKWHEKRDGVFVVHLCVHGPNFKCKRFHRKNPRKSSRSPASPDPVVITEEGTSIVVLDRPTFRSQTLQSTSENRVHLFAGGR
ncbi:hypothetical protein DFH08DRAFT_801674 [Mycena albidolilacea]|uniref:Uncharacterized protein n=1 Tax=Mycena albidolilacea TaxID=1033008 RepID=A0AAD7AJ33_9AGAR|nr:hypothetical protein DFH08DRAFT_801674 [Mycena albidolilacea]